MPEIVTFTIDDETVEASEGTSVLTAALDAGICIPNLCFLPETKPTGACRICVVEVEKGGRTKMTAACSLGAKEGMVIHAHSENVLRARRNVLELLLADAPESAVLRTMADRLELDDVRYPERDLDCVLCGRCVVACAEIAETGTKGLIGRGIARHIGLPFYKEEYCDQCYECTDRCVMELSVAGKRGDPCGVCGSELSKNEEIPEICEACVLD